MISARVSAFPAGEPHCPQNCRAAGVADPARLWLHEVYRDEAAFAAHGRSAVIRGLADKIAPLTAERHLARTRKLIGIARPSA